MLDDNAIIDLYDQREEAAIRETDHKYGRMLYGASYRIVANAQDAEECVSDTYLNVWNSIPPQHPNCFRAFLLRIIRNLSINRLRALHAHKRGGGEYQIALEELNKIFGHSGREDMIDEMCLRETLNLYLGALSEEKRAIFIGRYWYFESIKEISRNLKLGESKVKMTLLRCRKDLKEILEREGFQV